MTKSGQHYPSSFLKDPLCEGDGPFRPNVAGLILRRSPHGPEILLGERTGVPDSWQWPQGGLEPGEEAEAGLRRELEEEIGVARLHILYKFPFTLQYRFPVSLKDHFKRYIGQEQTYFIVKLLEQPDLARATTQEFGRLEWRLLDSAVDSAIWFKKEVYRRALEHAREVLPTLPL